jgi:diguanylate cyclase (GGDEF)-like protein
MPIAVPALFLLLQAAVLMGLPNLAGGAAAYVCMVVAPLLAAGAVAWRARAEAPPARAAWFALALALVCWACGAFGNLWQELILGRANEMYRASTLAFNLAAVPIVFLLASEWRSKGRRLARIVDALLALALGVAYFLLTWAMLTERGAPDDAGVASMVRLEDAQNLFVLSGALVRWKASAERSERNLFGALSAYLMVYSVLVALNNHVIAGDPAYGPQLGSIISVAFAVLAAFALRGASGSTRRRPPLRMVRAVGVASPLMLTGALLIVSLFLIRIDYPVGVVGIVAAVLGHALRNAAAQMRHIERGDLLKRERSKLRAIAWTDALTGVPNRHFLDRALVEASRRDLRATDQPPAVLMIDVDHFKLFNDHYGHPNGDACLRAVAKAMQDALVRPGDVLARYGGEEFIALIRAADLDGGLVVAERLRAVVQGLQIAHHGSPFGVVTVSIGVASLGEGATAATDLVRVADSALYEAKCAGRNQVRGAPAKTPTARAT